MRSKTTDLDRRRFMRGAIAGVIAVPVAGLVGTRPVSAADMPKLDPNNGQAKALNYVHDAAEAASNPAFQEGSDCGNCVQWTGGDSEWGGCNIFPGKAVARDGWCTAWAPRG
jgi:hypothetical protein